MFNQQFVGRKDKIEVLINNVDRLNKVTYEFRYQLIPNLTNNEIGRKELVK